jgi:hypothetical protein
VRAEAIAEPAGLGIPVLVTLALFIALLVLVEPGGGWARDWDIGTGAGTLVALAAAFALARSPRDGGLSGVEGTIVMVGCVVSVSLWGLHASESIALRRLETLVTAHPRWSAATRGWMYDFAGANALNRGDAHGAVERFQASIDVAGPNPRLFYQIGLAHRAAHEWREAESAFAEAAKRNPAVLGAWRGLAEAALAAGDTATARAAQDSIAAHRPRPAPAAVP